MCFRNLFVNQDQKLGQLCGTVLGNRGKRLLALCGFSSSDVTAAINLSNYLGS